MRYFWWPLILIPLTAWAAEQSAEGPLTEKGSADKKEAAETAMPELRPRLLGPEIWRLPPVVPGQVTPATLYQTPPQVPSSPPPALAVPPADQFPLPEAAGEAPRLNSPWRLDDVSSQANAAPEKVKLWSGSMDLGLDGSEGNTEALNFHLGFHAQRKSERSILTLGLDYNKRTNKTILTTDRMYFDGRWERLLAETRWSLFAHETVEYDEFQPFEVRDTTDLGVGYRFIKNENTTLLGRLGGGFSHEHGGPNAGEYVPEFVFGTQLEHQIDKRHKLLGAVEYAPDVTYFYRYRLRTQAAWECLLDDERNLSLRIGVLERYNSMPGAGLRNDLDYAMTLLWKF